MDSTVVFRERIQSRGRLGKVIGNAIFKKLLVAGHLIQALLKLAGLLAAGRGAASHEKSDDARNDQNANGGAYDNIEAIHDHVSPCTGVEARSIQIPARA